MYKAQHHQLVSVLNLIFAVKRQEDIERLERDNASARMMLGGEEKGQDNLLLSSNSKKARLLPSQENGAGTPKQEYQTKKWEDNYICCTDEDTIQ